MGGKGGTTSTSVELPSGLRSLFDETAGTVAYNQRNAPLFPFTQDAYTSGAAFQTAGRAPQFGYAGDSITTARDIAGETLGARNLLTSRPDDVNNAIQTAAGSRGIAGLVPTQYGDLSGVAQREVGLQDLESQATQRAGLLARDAGEVPGTFAEVRGQADPRIADLYQLADRQVTGANLQDSPSYQAAIQAFESAIMPTIQNSAALSGLGRSTGLQQSLAAGQAQYLLPVIQDELAREERGIDRGLGARQFGITTLADLGLQQALAEERGLGRGQDANRFAAELEATIGGQLAQRQESGIERELAALMAQGQAEERGTERRMTADQFLAGQQFAAGQQDLQRNLELLGADERARALRYDQAQQAVGQYAQLGQLEQDYQQGILDRQTQDYLRRQALAEQALYQPFGGFVPSTFGQTSSTSGKK